MVRGDLGAMLHSIYRLIVTLYLAVFYMTVLYIQEGIVKDQLKTEQNSDNMEKTIINCIHESK